MLRHIHPEPFIIRPPEDFVKNNPHLQRMGRQLALKYVSHEEIVTEKDLQSMGSALWQALGLDEAFGPACKAAGAAVLPIILESSASDVQSLPWETLFHPQHGFLARHIAFTFTRRFNTELASPPPLEPGPLRVLLFTSLPDDVDAEKSRLNVEEEQVQVQEALMPWISKGLVQLEMPDDGRFSTLQELLKKNCPHLLFLSGHGKFHHQPHTGEPPFGVFLFESEDGLSDEVREDELALALVGSGLQCVVLSACESGKAASDALNNGLARRLSELGIPHVIGMRESVLDTAGIQFARTLFDELGGQERLDAALQSARAAMQKPLKDSARRNGALSEVSELSLGQWCLPMLLSAQPERPLVEWNFQPQTVQASLLNDGIRSISLPARFVGRRAELRRFKNSILKGQVQKLLISGPGGQGKTSLAGKLALDLLAAGYQVFAWSARPEKPWRGFQFELELALQGPFAEQYDRMHPRVENEGELALLLLRLLLQQSGGRLVLFLDNLETLQDPDTLALTDARAASWLETARNLPELVLLVTSRWLLPGWSGAHLPLTDTSYGDFLQMAQFLSLQGKMPARLLENRERMRRIYDALGGNGRGLEFYLGAERSRSGEEDENAFLGRLQNAKAGMQANMAIEEIHKHLPPNARALLARLPVYPQPVPLEGLVKLGLDLGDDPQPLLERLLAVSLLEARPELQWDVIQYRCEPLAADWLLENRLLDADPRWLEAAADYQVYLFEQERPTLQQALAAHAALLRAGRQTRADRLALDFIVGPLSQAGRFHTLLDEWLPAICHSLDLSTRGKALNQTGKLNLHIGNFKAALAYLKQSLTIMQQIGDKAGEGTTLNNISQIFKAQGDYETALAYLKQSLTIMQQIGDKAGEGTTLNNISQIYDAQGDYETALAYLKQSLTIRQQIGDKAGEGTTLNNISALYHAQGDYETALAYLKQSLTIMQQIGDKAGEGTTLNNISQIFKAQGDYETALAYLKQSLTIRQQIGDKAGEGTTLNNISQIYDAQGDYETALAYLKQSLTIRQQIGDKAGEGTTLNNISALYHAQGDYETALAYLKQSLTIMQQIGDKAGEGTTLNNISALYHAQGDYETALAYLKQSLTIRQQIGDKAGEGTTLNNISQIYDAQGDYETALAYLKQSLTIMQQIGDKAGEGTTLNNISQIFKAQGDYETALAYLKQSLTIMQQIGDKAGEGTTLNNISQIFKAQGDYETALAYLKQSLTIRQQIGDKAGEGTTLNNISQIYDAQGDYETALAYLKQSLTIRQQIGDKAGLCATLFNIGHIHAQKDEIQEAVSAWVTVYKIAKSIGLAQALQALAQLAPRLGLPPGLDGWEKLAQQFKE